VLTDIAERLELTEAQVQSYLVAARGKVFHQALKKR
jgi:predicted transcriptional regulator